MSELYDEELENEELADGELESSDTNQAEASDSADSGTSEKKLGKKPRWYAVQVASGCEKRVKVNLEQRLDTLDVKDNILRVEIPETPIVKMRKDGSRATAEEKIFPGYVLIYMHMDDETWQVVKNIPNVINFVGAEQRRRYGRGRGHVKPLPLSHSEVQRIFKRAEEQQPVVKVEFAEGDRIMVLNGPFKDFEGNVIEVTPDRNKLRALLSIFGRDTPVELEFNQVEKQT